MPRNRSLSAGDMRIRAAGSPDWLPKALNLRPSRLPNNGDDYAGPLIRLSTCFKSDDDAPRGRLAATTTPRQRPTLHTHRVGLLQYAYAILRTGDGAITD